MIQVYFVCEGKNVRNEVGSLPGVYRESPDALMKSISNDMRLGIRRIMLFGVPEKKDASGSGALRDDSCVNHAVKRLKDKYANDLFVSVDICLCSYTDTGHCGVAVDGRIDNDRTIEILRDMAVLSAKAGCDCVAPSDMMDGRVGEIRNGLDDEGFTETLIMAYSAKYASGYYGPFREAADCAPKFGDRRSYQMDFRNSREALKEVALDLEEGADIVMVKPALAYLDIISAVRAAFDSPVAAFNVSGEYAMVKLLAREGYADEKQLVIENLTAIARAGADIILTYHLRDILKNGWLDE
jgi:porphobilinogen synthase